MMVSQTADSGLVYSSFRNDPDYAELLEMFVEELPDKQATFLELGRSRDFESARREAHKLRGSAGGYGFHGLSALAGSLEDSCKNAPPQEDTILREIEELIDYLGRVRA